MFSRVAGSLLALAVAQGVACATEFTSTATAPGVATVVFTWNDVEETLTLQLSNWAPVTITGQNNTAGAIVNLLEGLHFGENISDLFTLTSFTADILTLSDGAGQGGQRPLAVTVSGRGEVNGVLTSSGLEANGVFFGSYTNPINTNLNSAALTTLMTTYNGQVFGGDAKIVLTLKTPQTFDVSKLDSISTVQFTYNAGTSFPDGQVTAGLTPAPGDRPVVYYKDAPTTVPEPASLMVLGIGAVGLLMRRRSR